MNSDADLARLRSSAGTLDVSERQRVLRLLVKDMGVGLIAAQTASGMKAA